MARPITLFTIQWGDLSLEEVCRLAKEMGLRAWNSPPRTWI